MRFLLITNLKPGRGGISGQVELLQRKLIAEGHQADLFSTCGGLFKRLLMPFKLRRVAKAYDVLHVHCCSGAGFLPAVYGVGVAKRICKRVVVTYHGGGAGAFLSKWSKLVRHYLLRSDANIVLSGFIGSVFDQYGIPYVTIPNVIELDESCYRCRDVIKPRFISVRTLSELYNVACIIKAFGVVRQQLPEATLTIVGDGPERDALESQASQYAGISFIGRVPNGEIYNYLDEADIMLSSPHIDNMPVSILEAINAGLLVISSNVGGVPYMITDGISGMLFPDDDADTLAQKMLQAVREQEPSKLMIAQARKTLPNYSWPAVWSRLQELYFG